MDTNEKYQGLVRVVKSKLNEDSEVGFLAIEPQKPERPSCIYFIKRAEINQPEARYIGLAFTEELLDEDLNTIAQILIKEAEDTLRLINA